MWSLPYIYFPFHFPLDISPVSSTFTGPHGNFLFWMDIMSATKLNGTLNDIHILIADPYGIEQITIPYVIQPLISEEK
jgi:hypothetical protein